MRPYKLLLAIFAISLDSLVHSSDMFGMFASRLEVFPTIFAREFEAAMDEVHMICG
jgi:hypothetical protein